MLIMDMSGALLSILVLIFLEFLRVKLLLWAMTITFGLSIASIFATAFSIPPSLNVSITSRAASIMVGKSPFVSFFRLCWLTFFCSSVGASIGDMTLPMIAGDFQLGK